jgi:hypothetical protein
MSRVLQPLAWQAKGDNQKEMVLPAQSNPRRLQIRADCAAARRLFFDPERVYLERALQMAGFSASPESL